MIGCLRTHVTRVRKQPIIVLYFEFENELKFYNLKASTGPGGIMVMWFYIWEHPTAQSAVGLV